MLTQELLITGLRKQKELLSGLISQLERKQNLDLDDSHLYDEITQQVQKNLKKLRKIKGYLAEFQESITHSL